MTMTKINNDDDIWQEEGEFQNVPVNADGNSDDCDNEDTNDDAIDNANDDDNNTRR